MNNLELMKKRLNFQGGNQEGRMIKAKYKTFLKTLLYSYQAAEIENITQGNEEVYKCLINPDKNSTNYDDKIISIDYAYGTKPGDIINWKGTNSHWIVYLPELTEDAYFRAEIRRCRYQLSWIDMEEPVNRRKKTTYAYIRGPVETKINSNFAKQVTLDKPNYSLEIYIPNNQETAKEFKRYTRFSFKGKTWEVQVVDDISMDGVIQIIAEEDYNNIVLDDPLNEKVTDAFYISPVIPEQENEEMIIGEQFIKPRGRFIYKISEEANIEDNGQWFIKEENRPIKIYNNDSKSIELEWTLLKSGQFTLMYKISNEEFEKTIVVESLF